jgi:hypothetical protein
VRVQLEQLRVHLLLLRRNWNHRVLKGPIVNTNSEQTETLLADDLEIDILELEAKYVPDTTCAGVCSTTCGCSSCSVICVPIGFE